MLVLPKVARPSRTSGAREPDSAPGGQPPVSSAAKPGPAAGETGGKEGEGTAEADALQVKKDLPEAKDAEENRIVSNEYTFGDRHPKDDRKAGDTGDSGRDHEDQKGGSSHAVPSSLPSGAPPHQPPQPVSSLITGFQAAVENNPYLQISTRFTNEEEFDQPLPPTNYGGESEHPLQSVPTGATAMLAPSSDTKSAADPA